MARDLDYLFNTPKSSRLRNKNGSASGRVRQVKVDVKADDKLKLRRGSLMFAAAHETTAVSRAHPHAQHDVTSPTMFLVLQHPQETATFLRRDSVQVQSNKSLRPASPIRRTLFNED